MDSPSAPGLIRKLKKFIRQEQEPNIYRYGPVQIIYANDIGYNDVSDKINAFYAKQQ